jgi:prevent-host-death family protein
MAEADPKFVNIHEAKTHLSKLVERAHAGEEIIVAKAGKPYARLMPLAAEPRPPRQPGQLRHLRGRIPSKIWFEPAFTDEELDRLDNEDL